VDQLGYIKYGYIISMYVCNMYLFIITIDNNLLVLLLLPLLMCDIQMFGDRLQCESS